MKTFPIKISDELHEELRIKAFKERISLHEYIVRRLTDNNHNKTNTTNTVRQPAKKPLSIPKPPPIIESETITLSTGEILDPNVWDWACRICHEDFGRDDISVQEFAALIEEHLLTHPRRGRRGQTIQYSNT